MVVVHECTDAGPKTLVIAAVRIASITADGDGCVISVDCNNAIKALKLTESMGDVIALLGQCGIGLVGGDQIEAASLQGAVGSVHAEVPHEPGEAGGRLDVRWGASVDGLTPVEIRGFLQVPGNDLRPVGKLLFDAAKQMVIAADAKKPPKHEVVLHGRSDDRALSVDPSRVASVGSDFGVAKLTMRDGSMLATAESAEEVERLLKITGCYEPANEKVDIGITDHRGIPIGLGIGQIKNISPDPASGGSLIETNSGGLIHAGQNVGTVMGLMNKTRQAAGQSLKEKKP